MTLTDVAVAAGRISLGDRNASRISIQKSSGEWISTASPARPIAGEFERAGKHVPIILVGGGAPLIHQLLQELGRQVVCPAHADIANAYGAAMAQVGGEADLTFSSASISRQDALAAAEREANRRAVEAGASPEAIVTVELEDAAFSYLASTAMRVRARVVGDIAEDRE